MIMGGSTDQIELLLLPTDQVGTTTSHNTYKGRIQRPTRNTLESLFLPNHQIPSLSLALFSLPRSLLPSSLSPFIRLS